MNQAPDSPLKVRSSAERFPGSTGLCGARRERSPAQWRGGRLSVVDVKVALVDGSYHEVDSSEMAFKIAGSIGFKEAAAKADQSSWNLSCA